MFKEYARSQGSRSRDPNRYKPGKKGGMCISSLGHFSNYQLTYRQDGLIKGLKLLKGILKSVTSKFNDSLALLSTFSLP